MKIYLMLNYLNKLLVLVTVFVISLCINIYKYIYKNL